MKIVVFGLSLSSSWGNGHATTFRALLRALAPRHEILFLERDQPWYAENRDLPEPDFCRLAFYDRLEQLLLYRDEIAEANVVMLGSFVPEGIAVATLIDAWRRGVFCFYDIDTPVTLAKLQAGDTAYLSPEVIPLFDIYFSFTGGPTLQRLRRDYQARTAVPLHCSVDAGRYRPAPATRRWDLGYLGTYSPDRQPALERLLLEPARRAPHKNFVVAGPMYLDEIIWPANVERISHLPPDTHAAFYAAQAWTLNITRVDMIAAGHSPSVRLFEASACGVPMISDNWPGLETIFTPGQEIEIAANTQDILDILMMPEARRAAIGAAGRVRCLAAHTAARRAVEFEAAIAAVPAVSPPVYFAGALS